MSAASTYRPGFPGEHHAILLLPGRPPRPGRANYMGPGTQLYKRLARGDPPRTDSDRAARAHDIRYALAKTPQEVTRDDRKLVEVLRKIRERRSDYAINTLEGELPIRAKIFAETHGLLKPGRIGGYGDAPPELEPYLREFLEKEAALGYGLRARAVVPHPDTPAPSAQGRSQFGSYSIL